MKFIRAFTSGAFRALRSVKALLIIWLLTFTVLSVFTYPLRSFTLSALGNTTATNLLNDGFNISFFADLGNALRPMLSAITAGLMIVMLIFFFLYVFMNGGLFDSLYSNKFSYKASNFFRSSAKYFLSFLLVKLLVLLMILVAMFIVLGLPQILFGTGSEETTWKIFSVTRIVAIIILPLFLLVADYSRVWLVANSQRKIFRALAYGFKATFKSFFSSYFFMLIMVLVQAGFAIIIAGLLSGYVPATGGGLFLLFLLAQVLFIIKLYLRAVRYGGVSELYQI